MELRMELRTELRMRKNDGVDDAEKDGFEDGFEKKERSGKGGKLEQQKICPNIMRNRATGKMGISSYRACPPLVKASA